MCDRFIVMTSSASVKGKAARFGRYRNVAVVETDGELPSKISIHDRHVVGIVHHYGACNEGKTLRCEYMRVLTEAQELAAQLNKEAASHETRDC